jgi:class 3 adenylate cyclase/predicted ATPase
MPSVLETLGSYVPTTIVRYANQRSPHPPEPAGDAFEAVALFADISGFTALTERLAARGPSGAEELTTILNGYFGSLIDFITDAGGDVVKFAGDALLALWPVPPGADAAVEVRRVLHCCTAIQRELHDRRVTGDIRLALKVAVGVGEVRTAILGGVFDRWEFLVTGSPLSQVGLANHHASPGNVVASAEAWALVRQGCRGEALGDGAMRVTDAGAPVPPRRADAVALTPPAVSAVRAFIPAAIRSRVDAGQTDWLSELRRATVLFVNLPDFNAATPLDQAQEAMHTLQTALYRFEGSVNKISVDDKGASLIAVLGLPPLAHENDPERGVRAALAMQASLTARGLRSSIGIATGLIFCGSVGSDRRREYTVMGDTVNLAARLMQAAGDGSLCEGPTRSSVRGRLEFDALRPLLVKGKREPVEVFRPRPVDESEGAESAATAAAGLVGRTAERARLMLALDRLVGERRGERLVIEGEAGSGKSRLLGQLAQEARQRGVTPLIGAGDSVERSTPYRAWRPVFVALFGLERVGHDPDARRLHILEQLPEEPAVLRAAPLLSAVLPFDWPDNEFTAPMAGKVRADALNTLITTLLTTATAARPTLVMLRDVQWLDSASWALVLALAERVPGLALVLSGRSGSTPAAEYTQFLAQPGAERIPLGGLPPADVVAMACGCLGVPSLPEPVADLIVRTAEGNPLFVEELAYALRDSGVITVAGGQCRIAPAGPRLEGWSVPDNVQGVVRSRIDRLPPAEQMTLKVASVVGRTFIQRTLRDVHPIEEDREHLGRQLEFLRALDLTPLASTGRVIRVEDTTYRFKNGITQDVAYNLMLFGQRRQLHRAIAEWYESVHAADLSPYYALLAHHWQQAASEGLPDPELHRAVAYLQKAGDDAVRHNANLEAIGFYGEALGLLEKVRESDERNTRELELQLALGAVLIATQGYGSSRVEHAYSRARELNSVVGDRAHLFQALRGLWAFRIGRAEFHEARKLGEELLRLASGDPDRQLEAHRAMGNALFWLGELAASQEYMERGIRTYVADRDRALSYLYAQNPDVANRGMQAWPLSLRGYPQQALERGRQALDHAREIAHPYSLGYALVHDMCCRQYLLDVPGVVERARECIALATDKGFPNWLLAAMILQGWAQGQTGKPAEGAGQIAYVISLWRGTGSALAVPYFLALLAETHLAGGKHDEGLAALDDALTVVETHDDRWYEAEIHRLRGLLQQAKGADPEPAFRKSLEIARTQSARLLQLRTAMSLAELFRARGKATDARAILREAYDWFREGHDTPLLKAAKAALDRLERAGV